MMDNAYVYLDGGYLSEITKNLFNGRYNYDLKNFANTLAKENRLWCKKAFFYTAPPFQGTPPKEDEIKRKANYDGFISKIKKIPDVIVREGRCQKINGEFHQKGVDTHLTMDLMELITSNENINNIVVLACDTDFVPILNKIRKKGIKVILYYFTDRIRKSKFSMSNHILTACDKKIVICKEHFERSSIIKATSNQ